MNVEMPKHGKPLSAFPFMTENEKTDDLGLLCPIWQLLAAT